MALILLVMNLLCSSWLRRLELPSPRRGDSQYSSGHQRRVFLWHWDTSRSLADLWASALGHIWPLDRVGHRDYAHGSCAWGKFLFSMMENQMPNHMGLPVTISEPFCVYFFQGCVSEDRLGR